MSRLMSFDDSRRLYLALARALGVDRPTRITLTVGHMELAEVKIDRPLTAEECGRLAADLESDARGRADG